MPTKVHNDEQATVSLEMDRLWRPVFEKFDTNHDGKVHFDAFKRSLTQGNSALSEDIPPEVLDEIFERADWDGDKYLTYEEFLKMVHARDIGAHRPRLQRLIRYAAMAVVPRTQRATTIRRYLEEYNCMPPPFFLLLISIVEFVIYIYYCVRLGEFSATGPIPFQSPLIYDPTRRYEAWRYITYMFIHAGFIHIFFNLLIQLILGIPLEMVHKWWRIGLVYLSGVIFGSLAASITDPKTYLAGASGGVYALIFAHLANVTLNWKEMDFAWARLLALIVFGGTDIGVAIYDRYSQPRGNQTSYAAHLAGAIGGLLIGLIALRNLKVHKWETIVGWIAFAIFVLLLAAAILVNIFYKDHFDSPDYQSLYDYMQKKRQFY